MCNGLLHWRKNTRQQVFLSADERGDNLRGAFSQVGQLPVGGELGWLKGVDDWSSLAGLCSGFANRSPLEHSFSSGQGGKLVRYILT